jgi:hypothetical protein
MKKLFFILILLSLAILVYSQNRADTTVVIMPITGGSSEDEDFFEENLKMEVSAAGYAILEVENMAEAIYSVSASISTEDDGKVLSIALSDVAEDRELVSQELFYYDREETYENLPFLVWQMLANAPFLVSDDANGSGANGYGADGANGRGANGYGYGYGSNNGDGSNTSSSSSTDNSNKIANIVNLVNAVPEDDSWKRKWLYLGGKFGILPQLDMEKVGESNQQYISFGGGVEVGFRVLEFLAVQGELNYSLDKNDTVSTSLLSFPILVKGVFFPGKYTMLEPYGGIYITVPLEQPEGSSVPSLGWAAGVDFGMKAGPGILFLDLRYAADISSQSSDRVRNILALYVGYKYGVFNRRNNLNYGYKTLN